MVDELLEAKRLAVRLRRVRLERGLSLRGAAAKLGVTKETLSDLERARRQPHPPTLAKIADGYGVEISDLLGPMVEEPQAEEEPVLPGKAQAPSESGETEEERRTSKAAFEIAHNAAVEQARLDAQAIARLGQSKIPQESGVRAENEAFHRLRGFPNHELAEALVDMARRCVQAERENEELRRRLLQYLEVPKTLAELVSERAQGWHDEATGNIKPDAMTPDELRVFDQMLGDFHAAVSGLRLSELPQKNTSLPDPEYEWLHLIKQRLEFAVGASC